MLTLAGAAFGQKRPAWLDLPLTDARSGATFTLGSFEGTPVYVEPMATWCTNCRRMLGNVTQAMAGVADGEAVFVALSVEGALPPERLASYAEREGFPMRFAVATPDLIAALVGAFGRVITNPPLTPHFVVRPDGTVTDLSTGIEAPDAVLAFVRGEAR
jgi:thiol-disulfide isomerase/thioredoxin